MLRAIGWSSRRLISLVLGEALAVTLGGTLVGVVLGWGAIRVLEQVPAITGFLNPQFPAAVLWRAMGFASAMTLLGALYPSLRAARLTPLEAIRHE